MLKEKLEKVIKGAVFADHSKFEEYVTRLQALTALESIGVTCEGVQDIYVLKGKGLLVFIYTVLYDAKLNIDFNIVENKTTKGTGSLAKEIQRVLEKEKSSLYTENPSFLTHTCMRLIGEQLETAISGIETHLNLEKKDYSSFTFLGRTQKKSAIKDYTNLQGVLVGNIIKRADYLWEQKRSDLLITGLTTDNIGVVVGVAIDLTDNKRKIIYIYDMVILGVENQAPEKYNYIESQIHQFIGKLPATVYDIFSKTEHGIVR